MTLLTQERLPFHSAMVAAYPVRADVDLLVYLFIDRLTQNFTTLGDTLPVSYFRIISAAEAQGWILDLVEAMLDDPTQADNDALKAVLTPIRDRLGATPAAGDPEAALPLHESLRPDGYAFANRASLRARLADMLLPNGPRVLVLRGNGTRGLCGTSYAWGLINLIAMQAAEAKRCYVDFDVGGDHSPRGVIQALSDLMGFGDVPVRGDRPSAEQDAASCTNWFIGQLQACDKQWWIALDNAHRDHVPTETREMIASIAAKFSNGTIDNGRLFILGFERPISGLRRYAAQEVLHPIGKPELRDFLEKLWDLFGPIPDFDTVDEAMDHVLAEVDLGRPERGTLMKMSDKLTDLIERVSP